MKAMVVFFCIKCVSVKKYKLLSKQMQAVKLMEYYLKSDSRLSQDRRPLA